MLPLYRDPYPPQLSNISRIVRLREIINEFLKPLRAAKRLPKLWEQQGYLAHKKQRAPRTLPYC